MRLSRFVSAAVLVLFAAASNPAGAETLEKGTFELSPSLGFSHTGFSYEGSSQGSITTLNVNVLAGYCVSSLFEIAGLVIADHTSIDFAGGGTASGTSMGLGGGVQLNFSTGGMAVPFVRGVIGFTTNSGDFSGDETTLLTPLLDAGVRLMVGRSASVNCGVGYRHLVNADGVKDLSANVVTLNVGVSVFPGRP